MKRLRIGRRRAQAVEVSPLERALAPALDDGRWRVPDRFNFTRDVVEVLARDPKRQALTFVGTDGIIEPRTFRELAEGAARWASILRNHEVRAGDRVLALSGATVDWVELVLGCVKAGAIVVSSPPDLTASALEARFALTGASLIVAGDESKAEIAQMSFAPDVRHLFEGRRRRSSDVVEDEPTEDTSSRDVAFVAWTAGTSGAPKPVAHTHGATYAARVPAAHWLDAGPGDVVWSTAAPDSLQSLSSTVFGAWACGAQVALHGGAFDPVERLELLHRFEVTIVCQTPAEYRALAGRRELPRYRSRHLRRLVSTGDTLAPDVIDAFAQAWGAPIRNGYGQAETNVVVAHGPDDELAPSSLGRPLPGHHVAVVDDQGNDLPQGVEGNLAVRGRPPTMFSGYWDSPDETRAGFRGDWYFTGDVAVADEDGTLWFVSRAEDTITSRGRTFGPGEVEQVLRTHKVVRDNAVVGIRDLERGGHFVRAFVVLEAGVEASEQLEVELRQFSSQSLSEQQVPREIEFVDALPVAVSGAVRRGELRERPVAGRPLWEVPPTSEPEVDGQPAQAAVVPPTVDVAPAAPPPDVAPVVVEIAPEPVAAPAPVDVVEAPPPAPAEPVAPSPSPEPTVTPEPAAPPEPAPAPPEPMPAAASTLAPTPPAADEAGPDAPDAPTVGEAAEQPAASTAPAVERRPGPEAAPPEPAAGQASPPEPALQETVASARPAPLVEPVGVPEGEAQPEPGAEPVEASALPEPLEPLEPPVSPEPPEPPPEPTAEVEPAPRVEQAAPEAARPPEPVAATEPAPPVEPEPLPDFVVDPSVPAEPAPSPPQPLESVPPEVEEEEEDLGPLPEYIVDPTRPRLEPVASAPPPAPAPPPLDDPDASPASLFPPVPVLDLTAKAGSRDDADRPAAPRTRPAATPGDPKRSGTTAEPGDEAAETSWMQGLSSRLSAYSLGEEQPERRHGDEAGSDDDEEDRKGDD